jgi:transketolase
MLEHDDLGTAQWREFRRSLSEESASGRTKLLENRAREKRRRIIEMIATAGLGHVGGDLSVTDILTVLYDAVLDIDPADPGRDDRDRLVLSKGHCAAALYTSLAMCGYFPVDELATFMQPLSPLNGHPNRTKVPGVETNTGPLGHGLPYAVGAALGQRLRGNQARVFVIVGDGELQEGSNWEALMAAGHFRLDNLFVVVDRNRLQQGDRTESTNALDPLADKLTAFGLEVREVDGHDYAMLLDAFDPSTSGRPVGVIANTIKGRGVSFMEDRVEWHHKVPTDEQVARALAELQ